MDLRKEKSQDLNREKRQATTMHRYRPSSVKELYRGRCTFCGEPLEPGIAFCTECGNSVNGITCPRCGTLSFRCFCSNCNYPLNEQAQEAIAEAKKDPHFQRAEQLAREMAELEKIINEAQSPTIALDERPDESCTLSDEARNVLSSYAELFAGGVSAPQPQAPTPKPQAVTKKERQKFTMAKLKDAVAAYKEKAAELQRQMDAMLPPSAATPEEQRNFFSARKIMTVTLSLQKQEWVCNYCGCHHKQPSECVEPELGGTWIFAEVKTMTESTIFD